MALTLEPLHSSPSHRDDGFPSGDAQDWIHVSRAFDGAWFSSPGTLAHAFVGNVIHGVKNHSSGCA